MGHVIDGVQCSEQTETNKGANKTKQQKQQQKN